MLLALLALLTTALLMVFATCYNRLVRDKNRVFAAWSDIAVQLKRRHDLIPKLVDVVKSYSGYEENTLNELTRLRSQSTLQSVPRKKANIENELTTHLHGLLAIMESYPDLKAGQHYLSLQDNLTAIENDIQSARRYYNGAVGNLNIRIDSFPDLIIARLFRFKPAEFFELDTPNESLPTEIKS